MLGRIFRAIRRAVQENRERHTIYYPIASDGYIGECYLCGDSVYEGDEFVSQGDGCLYVCHEHCYDLPFILGL